MTLALAKGDLFAEDYRIERRLGEGGMGHVYVATQLSTSAPRALKLMHVHLLIDATLRRRFEQEARISAKIRSDHVVQVTAAGVDEASRTPWLAMELLEGETLAQLIARTGRLEAPLVAEIAVQLCHALAAAHAVGVVHRDLKPENVFIAKPQRPGAPFTLKVLDFGISKVLADALTKSTEPLGTPLWMSPEQTQHDQPVTPASDVWSLGLLMFYLLTGKLYWRGEAGQTSPVMLLRQIVIDPLPSATERAREHDVLAYVPAGFDAWFARCVTREPTARFSNAGEAQEAFAALFTAGQTPDLPLTPSITVRPAQPRSATPFELGDTGVPSKAAPTRVLQSKSRLPAYLFLAALACGLSLFLFRAPKAAPTEVDAAASVTTSAASSPSAASAEPVVSVETAQPSASATAASVASSAPPRPSASFDEAGARAQLNAVFSRMGHCVEKATVVTVELGFEPGSGRSRGGRATAPKSEQRRCIEGVVASARIGVAPFAGHKEPTVSVSAVVTPPRH